MIAKLAAGIGLLLAVMVCPPVSAATPEADAERLAASAPLARRAVAALEREANAIKDQNLNIQTRDALFSRAPCIAYLNGLDAPAKAAMIRELMAQGFAASPEALRRSLLDYPHPGSACPARGPAFVAAPGGEATGHHAWPGGLAVHEAFNIEVIHALVRSYRRMTGEAGALDEHSLVAAALWHDWAKTLEFQWTEDGIESFETPIAGTGAHHILGLAEAMARRLPAKMIVIQACAHAAPEGPEDAKLIGWLRAAAIIARVDPVARGYLTRGPSGALQMAASPECFIEFQSDQNWVLSEPALHHAVERLAALAPDFGYDPSDKPRYARYVYTALSFYGAERLDLAGPRRMRALLLRLRRLGKI